MVLKKNTNICFYGYEQLNENTRSLIEYMIKNEKYGNYQIFLFSKKNPIDNKKIRWTTNKIIGLFYLFRSTYIFHAQGMGKAKFKSVRNQKIVNIWHGTPLKSIGKGIKSDKELKNYYVDDFCVMSSGFFEKIYIDSFGYDKNQLIVSGNPRNDYLYTKQDIKEKMKIQSSRKIVLFMPTFRQSNNGQYNDSKIDFPIVDGNNILELDKKLEKLNIFLVIKPHPYQINLDFFKLELKSIKIITDDYLNRKNIRLYTLIGNSDALITDYSSVFFDYLLINKPIGFTIPDIDIYSQKRGFSIENPTEIMPGQKIYNFEELIVFFYNVSLGIDNYECQRLDTNDLVNYYTGKKNSEFLLQLLGIG